MSPSPTAQKQVELILKRNRKEGSGGVVGEGRKVKKVKPPKKQRRRRRRRRKR